MIPHRKEPALQGMGEKGCSSYRQKNFKKRRFHVVKLEVSLRRDEGNKVKTQFLVGGDGQHP